MPWIMRFKKPQCMLYALRGIIILVSIKLFYLLKKEAPVPYASEMQDAFTAEEESLDSQGRTDADVMRKNEYGRSPFLKQ